MKRVLEWATTTAVPDAKEIMKRMEVEVSRRKLTLKESEVTKIQMLALHDLGTKEVLQVLEAFLAFHTYGLKNGQIRNVYFYLLCERTIPVTSSNGKGLLSFVLDDIQVKVPMPYKMNVPTSAGADLYFHERASVSRGAVSKKPNMLRNEVISLLAGILVQFVQNDPDEITTSCLLPPQRAVMNL